MRPRSITQSSFALGLVSLAGFAFAASAAAGAGSWTFGLETRFISADGGLVSAGKSAVDDQAFFAPLRAMMDAILIVDLSGGTANVDSVSEQVSLVEPTRLTGAGSARAHIELTTVGDNAVGNARSKYEVDFTLTEPTRLRFEARVAETGLGQAFVQIRQGLFQVIRGITSEDAEPAINEFITLPAGHYTLHAETQLSVFSFQPATRSGTGEFTVLLAPSNATLVGDLNCDGILSVGDIGPFVLALTQPDQYAADFPNCEPDNGDINADGVVSVGDIGTFVQLLIS